MGVTCGKKSQKQHQHFRRKAVLVFIVLSFCVMMGTSPLNFLECTGPELHGAREGYFI